MKFQPKCSVPACAGEAVLQLWDKGSHLSPPMPFAFCLPCAVELRAQGYTDEAPARAS